VSVTFGRTMALLAKPGYMSDRTGSQVYVSRYGDPVLEAAVGLRAEGCEMTVHSRVTWLCCSKPVLLIPLLQALTEAGVDESEPVATFIPEFANADKGDVRLSHVLTHTVPYRSLGMTWADGEFLQKPERPVMEPSWEAAINIICEMPIIADPGEIVTYTPATNWMVLAEILERLTGRHHEESVAKQALVPLGMDNTSVYVTNEDLNQFEYAPLWNLDNGDEEPCIEDIETRPLVFGRWPGLACRGPARDMARPIECAAAWLHPDGFDGIWRAKLLTPYRDGLSDPTMFGAEVLWSLGLCVDPVRFALPLSAQVVGHTGERSSIVFADLGTGVTISFLSNGVVSEASDWRRKRALIRAIYDDLDLPLASGR
jgi:CubicO group peptidase (beta-lactamase class C family)